jgi:hypothetical protein
MKTTQATAHLIRSDKARTDKDGHTLDLQKDGKDLIVTTWGYDYERFSIPQTRQELIVRKMWLQLDANRDSVAQIELRYLLDILRRESYS